MQIFKLLGRKQSILDEDIVCLEGLTQSVLKGARCLVIGGAGTIGQAVVLELFKRRPKAIHVVDISENNMVELVRGIRSTMGYSDSDFRTFAIDCGSVEFDLLSKVNGPYEFVFNLSALKHVRSEKDEFTLMRMIRVNILNTLQTIRKTRGASVQKYFCVSTDKAANPVNLMGASKRIMELFLMRESTYQDVSMARFANVAFSDGSLLHGFNQRFAKRQPISAPNDVRRYFITQEESGQLCLLSAIHANNREILFPKIDGNLTALTFSEIAENYIASLGYEPYHCSSEEEARAKSKELISKRFWPCFFFKSDTSGEKDIEEFVTGEELVDQSRFKNVGVIKNSLNTESDVLDSFLENIQKMIQIGSWEKSAIICEIQKVLPEFNHIEKGKNLDQKM
jgi:FlaA1/EpsC-like NDP-sugar epimerase